MSQLTFKLVEGLYNVQVQLHGYENPSQQRVTCNQVGQCFGTCCDGGDGACTSGASRCDTFFIFCLRPSGSSESGCGSTSSGSVMQSNENINDATIDFSQSTFLGLSNPLVFQGLTNIWNVSHSAVRYFSLVS